MPTTADDTEAAPLVTVVCPTYNRRAFLPFMLAQFFRMDYPNKELLVLDDSPASNADLFEGFEGRGVRYVYDAQKRTIAEKRARLNELARGEYILCMDDDDVQHPDRIRHSVAALRASGGAKALAGATLLYVYYKALDRVYVFGPYADNHGTHGTMCYTRAYAAAHGYDPARSHAEEARFTNDFTEPMAQLDPRRTILCIAHGANTFDKNTVIQFARETTLGLRDFW